MKLSLRRVHGNQWFKTLTGGPHSFVVHEDDWSKVPHELFAVFGLAFSLNYASDLEDMRSMVTDAMERLQPGGQVIAIARAFDNGAELAERMVQSGVTGEDLALTNLSNREISRLQANSAILLTSSSVYRLSEDLPPEANALQFKEWVTVIRKSPKPPDIRFQPEKLVSRVVDIGLTWQKP